MSSAIQNPRVPATTAFDLTELFPTRTKWELPPHSGGRRSKGTRLANIMALTARKCFTESLRLAEIATMSQHDEGRVYRFGEFALDKGARTLLRNDQSILLTPKEFEALLILVESNGEAVGRDHLLRSVWPDTFVGDTSLARNISVLRKHLGAETIRTVPKYGYRFELRVTQGCSQAKVSEPIDASGTVVSESSAAQEEPSALPIVAGRSRFVWPLIAAVVVLGLIGMGVAARHLVLEKPVPARLAVLPFRNLSSSVAETDYLRDGLAEELTSHLSQLDYKQLRVLARGSTGQYLNTKQSPSEVATELGAGYLLDGTVAFDRGTARLTVEIVDGKDQTIRWSRQFSRPIEDLPSVQDEIVDAVASTVHVEIQSDGRHSSTPNETTSIAAHDEYLLGRYQLEQKTFAAEQQAIAHFERAVVLDYKYAKAYEGISETYIFMAGIMPERQAYSEARVAAQKALHLNNGMAEAHRNLAWILFNDESDLQGSEREYRRAIELNPDDARAHHWYSQLLAAERRNKESLEEATTGYQLDPRSLGSAYNYAFMLIEAGQAQDGVERLEELAKREPSNDVIWGYLGIGYARLRQFGKSAAAFDRAMSCSSLKVNYRAATAYALAMNGEKDKAKQIVEDLEAKSAKGAWIPGEAMAVAYIGLGDRDRAFAWLQKGAENGSVTLLEVNTDPIYTELSSDPRFGNIVAQLRRPR